MKIKSILSSFSNETSPIRFHHLLFFIVAIVVTPSSGFWFDMQDRPQWIAYMLKNGLANAYGSGANYLPFGLEILYFYGLIKSLFYIPDANFYFFKYFLLLFDFVVIISLLNAFRDKKYPWYFDLIVFLNIGYFHNTMFWGQQDAIHSGLVILSLIAFVKEKPTLGATLIVLAINAKLQAIVFLPIIGLWWLYFALKNPRAIVQTLVALVLIQTLIFLPFILGGTFSKIKEVVTTSVGFFPFVSWNAYNLWYLVLKSDPKLMNDSTPFFHFTYKKWGLLLFMAFSAFAIFPMIACFMKSFIKKSKNQADLGKIAFLVAGTVGLVFFFFNTQMHERYTFPCILLYFGYALMARKYVLYFLISLGYLLNVEAIYSYFHLNFVKPELVSLIFLAALILSFFNIFLLTKKNLS